jgi:pimeloyl-ACP methyl ester carboxylesterase
MLLDGFRRSDVEVDGVRIATWVRGQGPPVLLLHGYPQTHVMWHVVAPRLVEGHTVVVTDLRGYGESDAPPGGDDHAGYAKRAMAADLVGVMGSLGFERFSVVGHDRGARVGHRMALDHPDRVDRLAVIDIAPTHHVFATADRALAQAYFHWFFLAQPGGLPERMIGADPDGWLVNQLERGHGGGAPFDPEARQAYLEAFGLRIERGPAAPGWSPPAVPTTRRRPPSTSAPTTPSATPGWPVRCWSSGESGASSATATTCSACGGPTPSGSRAEACPAATSSPRSAVPRWPTSCWPS